MFKGLQIFLYHMIKHELSFLEEKLHKASLAKLVIHLIPGS